MDKSRDNDQKREESSYMEMSHDNDRKKMRIKVKNCCSKTDLDIFHGPKLIPNTWI